MYVCMYVWSDTYIHTYIHTSTFKVRTSNGEMKPINRERGIIQGCPWSVYGFLIGIDKWIRWLDDPNQTVTRPTAVQGYVDDVGAMATNMQGAQQVVQRTEQFINYARMEVKAPKCAHLYERCLGNNWYKKKTGEKTDLEINGEVIKQFPREKGYPYSGHFINLNSTWEEQMHLLDETFITRLEAIDKASFPITAKIEAIQCYDLLSIRVQDYFVTPVYQCRNSSITKI